VENCVVFYSIEWWKKKIACSYTLLCSMHERPVILYKIYLREWQYLQKFQSQSRVKSRHLKQRPLISIGVNFWHILSFCAFERQCSKQNPAPGLSMDFFLKTEESSHAPSAQCMFCAFNRATSV